MFRVKLRLCSVPNVCGNEPKEVKITNAPRGHSSVGDTTAPTVENILQDPCNKRDNKLKHDKVSPTFVVNGIAYREEPFALTKQGRSSADVLVLTEEDIKQMNEEFKACGSNSFLQDRTSGLPLSFCTTTAPAGGNGLHKPNAKLELNAHSLLNNKDKRAESSEMKLGKTRESSHDYDVEEVLVPLELCVMTPFVDEIWFGWPNPDHPESPSAALFSPILSLEESVKMCSNPFLCVYASPCARCLSQEVETVVCVALMRALRCHLLSLLRSPTSYGGDGLAHKTLSELLQKCCEVSGNACRVRWYPLMLQEVVKSLSVSPVFLRAQYVHSSTGRCLITSVKEGEEPFSVLNDFVDAHEAVVRHPLIGELHSRDGMDLWFDDADLSEGDKSPEERIIRASRRHFAIGTSTCDSDSIVKPLLQANGSCPFGLTTFFVRDLDLSGTCLPLQSRWCHCILKPSNAKNTVLRVAIDSLTPVRQSPKDERVAVRLIHRLYDNFLLPAKRHRESGNSNLGDLNVQTATEEDYRNVLHSYERCIYLSQRGLLLPYNAQRLSQGGFITTTPHRRYGSGQESRRRIHRVLLNLWGDISRDMPLHLMSMQNVDVNPKQRACFREIENDNPIKSSKDTLEERDPYTVLMGIPGDNYFNEVLLTTQLSGVSPVGTPSSMLSERLNGDPMLDPARVGLGSRHRRPLHLILYMLRRELVVGVANAALIVLRIHSLHVDSQYKSSSTQNTAALQHYRSSQRPIRWSVQLLERYARACDRASALALELLRWHTLSANADIKKKSVSFWASKKMSEIALDVQEVVWCVSIYLKLRLRGLCVWGCMGNEDRRQAAIKDLRDTLKRWDRQRQRTSEVLTTATTQIQVEHLFAKIPQSTWHRLLEDAQHSMSLV